MKTSFALIIAFVATCIMPAGASAADTTSGTNYFGKRSPGGIQIAKPQSATPEATPAPMVSGTDPILGSWNWYQGKSRTVFKADGTCDNGSMPGSWSCLSNDDPRRKYRFIWSGGKFVDEAMLSEDGDTMTVRNNLNVTFDVHRVIAEPQTAADGTAPPSPTPTPDPIVGLWTWQAGNWPKSRLEFRADGTVKEFNINNNGKWQPASSQSSERKYLIIWNGGTSIDNITLSFDRNKITGKTGKMPLTGSRIVLPTPAPDSGAHSPEDAAAAPALAAAPDPLVGIWRWKMGRWEPTMMQIVADGTVKDPRTGARGTWSLTSSQLGGRQYLITWNGGQDHNVITLSSDRKKLSGKNDTKNTITAERMTP